MGSVNNAITWTGTIGKAKARLTVEVDEHGNPVDISTAGYGNAGSGLDALWRCLVKAWDINLKPGRVVTAHDEHGEPVMALVSESRVPLDALQTFFGRMDETAGPTGDPVVPSAGGHADYLARSLLARIEAARREAAGAQE